MDIATPNTQQVPLDFVLELKKRGYSDNQIMQYLQSKGFSSTQIFEALTKAEEMTKAQQPPMQQPLLQESHATAKDASVVDEEDDISTEELVEQIIEEKWKDIEEDISKIVDWKVQVEAELTHIKEDIKFLKEQLESIQKTLIQRVKTYDQTMQNVDAKLNATIKAFSEFFPVFSENVKKLSEVVEMFEKKSPANKKTKNK